MAKTIYTPNRLLDIALASTLLVEFGFVMSETRLCWLDSHYFYREWKNFWFFSLSFVIIAVAVRLTEKAFYYSGKWLSSRFLSSTPYSWVCLVLSAIDDPLSKSYSMMKYTDQVGAFQGMKTRLGSWSTILCLLFGNSYFYKSTPGSKEELRFLM